ncbi:uncharacterized protein LOC129792806 [Lutzomyia longipalpis]|uniref:uncharacterized protein LOC129792806 n=1 Tax=Lutzomyia longipalpis TaxID=7200 RepID=UPI002483C630|nr:uncharacterized protein LOC129792806 [Lutzomyia longipalpis]
MTGKKIEGFGEELEKIEYSSFFEWLVSFEDPVNLYRAHPSYSYCQAIFLLGAAIISLHCTWKGGRWPFLFAAAIGQGLTVELASYWIPHIDNFWQSLTPVMFFGHRLPLYIIFLYPVFYYHSSWAVSKLKLRCGLVEHLAVGVLTVLIDLPYDIIGAKFVHWIWHDTDPNIADRHYWVPWNSYYFHASFAAFWSFIFHSSRKLFSGGKTPLNKWEAGPIKAEIASVILASLLGMPGGCLFFLILYHPFHDVFGVHSEVTTVTLLVTFIVIIWKFDRNSLRSGIVEKMKILDWALIVHLILHYLTFLGTAIFFNPEEQIIIGLHEPIGDCKSTVPVETLLKTLTKKQFLCATNYDEKYYDFHCLPGKKVPKDGSVWYTVCGTPFENRVEYILVLSLIAFVAFIVFSSIHFDGKQQVATVNTSMKSSRDTKKKTKVQ